MSVECNKLRDYNVPVMTTSVRFVPVIRLENLGPFASLPMPYEGNGGIRG